MIVVLSNIRTVAHLYKHPCMYATRPSLRDMNLAYKCLAGMSNFGVAMHAPFGTLILLQTRTHWSHDQFYDVQHVGHVGVAGLPCRIDGVYLQMIAHMSLLAYPFIAL